LAVDAALIAVGRGAGGCGRRFAGRRLSLDRSSGLGGNHLSV